jgi:dGTPase
MYDEIKNGLFSAPEVYAQRFSGKDNSPQEYRTMFMRDRDRILYSKSFRRLSGKTQIYLTGSDDHQRNRLTHTLEVSQIASSISQALGLNRDLTEAIALGHDLGHTPFGHAGEQALHLLMIPNNQNKIADSPFNHEDFCDNEYMGFKHNLHSVRMAVSLENIYGDAGLDLTNYTLWGLQRHSSPIYSKEKIDVKYLIPTFYNQYKQYYFIKDNNEKVSWSFEAFVVAEADEIAQLHHDLEDAIRGKAMSRSDVLKIVQSALWSIMSDCDRETYSKMESPSLDDETFIVLLSRIVVNTLVSLLIKNSMLNLNVLKEKYSINSENRNEFFLQADPNSNEIKTTISYSRFGDSAEIFKKLRKYSKTISTKVHNSYVVQRMNTKGQYVIRKLFQAYYSNPQQLPNHSLVQYLISTGVYQTKSSVMKAMSLRGEGIVRTKFIDSRKKKEADSIENKVKFMRTIADHIAGMTDSYALEEFERLYN